MTTSRMETPVSKLSQIVSWKNFSLLCESFIFFYFFQLEVQLRALGRLDSTSAINAQSLPPNLFVFLHDFFDNYDID